MKNRLNNILIGLLWLLVATLVTSFWFNTKFGFNIFAAPHWQYLAYMQASRTPVSPVFYISMGIAIFITISGLYILLQPRFKRIRLPIQDTRPTRPPMTQNNNRVAAPAPKPANTKPETQHEHQAAAPIMTAPTQSSTPPAQSVPPLTTPAAPTIPIVPLRPPRLNLTPSASNAMSPVIHNTTPATPVQKSGPSPELAEIFKNAGYDVKKSPFISGFQPGLFAIGSNEVLWIGAINTETTKLHSAIDKLNEIFTDTLDDIYINVNGFVINAPDAATSKFEDILTFDSISALSEYIGQHTNPPIPADDQENFDAYSEYIDTVIGYIGKL